MTLVLYDVENIKTAKSNVSKKSRMFNFLDLKEKIERVVGDKCVHVAFMSIYNDGTFRFSKLLQAYGIQVIAKKTGLKKSNYKGMEYQYYDNDTDALIVHYMVKYGDSYDTVVLVSGDKDLSGPFSELSALKIAIAWKDNMSKKMVSVANQVFYLDDLI